MSRSTVRVVAIVAVLALFALVLAVAASADPAFGTFTKISTPKSGLVYKFDSSVGAANPLTISGTTSNDVTSVDLDCLFVTGNVQVQQFAVNVPVTGGVFSTTAALQSIPTNCRLRAIPSGVDPTTAYLASYLGPILYFNTLLRAPDDDNVVAYEATAEQGTGHAVLDDAGTCGAAALWTYDTPGMNALGPRQSICAMFLPAGSSAPLIKVDGHAVFMPSVITGYLNNLLGLGVTQTHIATTITRHSNGDVTVHETAPLVRCSGDDTYPPTHASCPDVVSSGVTFARVADMFRGAHQIRFRDSYVSTDGKAHGVTPAYQSFVVRPPTGHGAYILPGQSSYTTATPDEVVTGFGTKAGTLLARYDVTAASDDPAVDTIAFSWTRAPSKIQFGHFRAENFAMPYSLHVPAGGKAYLGFAVSEAVTTAAAKSLASQATREAVVPPSISSPKAGAHIKGHLTTVKGLVTLGANGLPTAVTVNGHTAKLTKVNATTLSYAVSFSESFGKHTLTVVAKDIAGNTASVKRTVTNVS